VVGRVQVDDPDSMQTHTFKVISGNTYFGITPSGVIYVKDAVYKTFTTEKQFIIRVAVYDDGVLMARDSTLTLNRIMSTQKEITITLKPHPHQ